MNEINGDITKVETGFIFHQVNCKGVMGSGLALQIKKAFPSAYTHYRNLYESGGLILGVAQIVPVRLDKDLFVVNLAGQYNYGYGSKQPYTDYRAFDWALKCVLEHLNNNYIVNNNEVRNFDGVKLPIYFPYKIGCGLAGGDWKIVKGIIESYFPKATIIHKR